MHEFMEFVGAFCITVAVISYLVYVIVAVVEVKESIKDIKIDIKNLQERQSSLQREIQILYSRYGHE